MAALPIEPVTPPPTATTPYPGNVIQGPWQGTDIVPVAESEATAEVTAVATEAALPAALTVGDAVPVIGVGIVVEESLRNNPQWDHFWRGVGGHIDNLITSVFSDFGVSHVQIQDVDIRVGVLRHFHERLIRQLHTKAMAKIVALQASTSKATKALLNYGRAIDARHTALHSQGLHYTQAQAAAERAHADALARAVLQASQQLAHAAETNANAFAVQHVYAPLAAHAAQQDARIGGIVENLGKIEHVVIPAAVGAAVAPIIHALGGISARLQALEQEQNDCNEPMCETVGPKTDWGKLFKRFTPALIFAMLGELAALHPDAVRDASEHLAEGIGPVIEVWAEKWLGLLPGAASDVEGTVTNSVGGTLGISNL